MQNQVIKNKSFFAFGKVLSFALIVGLLFSAKPASSESEIDKGITQFYNNWIDVQRSTIPDVKAWADEHLTTESEIVFKVVAQMPALLDHKFHKTLKIDARKAEKHLVQWLNIHKHSTLDMNIIESIKEDDVYKNKVSYSAQGVTVLPNGKHKTIRLKTNLDVTCDDILDERKLSIIKSTCELNASSVPLRSLK